MIAQRIISYKNMSKVCDNFIYYVQADIRIFIHKLFFRTEEFSLHK